MLQKNSYIGEISLIPYILLKCQDNSSSLKKTLLTTKAELLIMELDDFLRDTKTNMYLSWLLTLSIVAVLIESALDFDILWILFSSLMTFVIILPALVYREHHIMLPWEVLLIGSIPVIVRTLEISILANQIATYTAMAALALIIAVELHIFTEIDFNHSFAVLFTVISTLALVGIWSVIQYLLDLYMSTSFLTTNEALMRDFLNATVAGVFAGVLFDTYFRRRDRQFRKLIQKVIPR